RLVAERRPDGIQKPELRLARRLPGVDELPDDSRADQRDGERREDEDLGESLAPDTVEEGSREQAQAHAAGRRDKEPDDIVAKDLEERPRRETRPVVERERALLVQEAADHGDDS